MEEVSYFLLMLFLPLVSHVLDGHLATDADLC